MKTRYVNERQGGRDAERRVCEGGGEKEMYTVHMNGKEGREVHAWSVRGKEGDMRGQREAVEWERERDKVRVYCCWIM